MWEGLPESIINLLAKRFDDAFQLEHPLIALRTILLENKERAE